MWYVRFIVKFYKYKRRITINERKKLKSLSACHSVGFVGLKRVLPDSIAGRVNDVCV
ncbi:MAG: hypothetical protein MUO31_05455 [Thermodesulfovibrionales bacterium]|nr:hypothetical protein [Thermodesulfovibrionales bacterium]